MRQRRLLWQLAPIYLAVVILSLWVSTWYATRSLRDFYLDHLTRELGAGTDLTAMRDAFDRALRVMQLEIVLAGLVIAGIATGFFLILLHRINRELLELQVGADRFARGDLESRLNVHRSEEIGGLAQAMNQMAQQLDARIRTIMEQRNELEAVLSSMVEGVLAVDTEERLISLNMAAANLLGVLPQYAQDKSLQQVVRNADLLRLVSNTLALQQPVESDIVLRENGERYLQAHATVLRDTEGKGIGALVVLNDVTRLRRLETVRRDFVANVSHEIRTPITSIKGFVETLQDGAIHDSDRARRFLDIIARQSERLNSIVDDLLTLSRIEEETENSEIALELDEIRPVLESAHMVCQDRAESKGIQIVLECEDNLRAKINPHLLEQAVINLVDNAIKHSEGGTTVRVAAGRHNGSVVIAVSDQGCGIAEEHIPRLFERFYRVDKGRSRQMGGTGLGLSIVKHIMAATKGRVDVCSQIGRGSTFSLYLPPE